MTSYGCKKALAISSTAHGSEEWAIQRRGANSGDGRYQRGRPAGFVCWGVSDADRPCDQSALRRPDHGPCFGIDQPVNPQYWPLMSGCSVLGVTGERRDDCSLTAEVNRNF